MFAKDHIFLVLLFCVLGLELHGQRSAVFTDPGLAFSKGQEFFDLGLYGIAQDEFRKILHQDIPAQEPQYRVVRKKAELLYAKSAVRLGSPEGQKLMNDFVRMQRPDPTANQALFELANYYFNARDYDEAIEYYSKIQNLGLSESELMEAKFKHGYALFNQKRYDEARAKLHEVRTSPNAYYEDANYYYGLTAFFNDAYDEALQCWALIESNPRYARLMPYYIGQIHARQGDHDALIAYLEPRVDNRGLKNVTEIQHMLGQAYFEKGNYEAALPYLTYYEEHSSRLRAQDFYQVALTQYKNGLYEDAIGNFRELNNENTEMGQSAMFYLADCYLRQGERSSARNAFLQVSRMSFDPSQQEEALYHYGRLSAELGLDRDAVKAFVRFQPQSQFYAETQQLLAQILVQTKDYANAIRMIEKMEEQTPTLKKAYQKVTYLEGLQQYEKRKFGKAYDLFQKSLTVPVSLELQAQATYWIAEMMHIQKQYAKSIDMTERFLTLASTTSRLPSSSSSAAGHYVQGYNYYQQEDFSAASKHFDEAIRAAKNFSEGPLVERAIPDAYLRMGDCNFKRGRYQQASRSYDQAIALQAPGFEYAHYQNAIINGLAGHTDRKIEELRLLVDSYPNSSYADNALFEMASTFQNSGNFDAAIPPLQRLITDYQGKSPMLNQAYLRLGLAHYNLGRSQESLDYYKTIFKNNPTSSEARDAMAAIEEIYVDDLGKPNEYVAFVESLPGYKVSDDERDALNYGVAERLYERGEYADAIDAYGSYIGSFPKGYSILDAYYFRGECHALLRQYDGALSDYLWVVDQGPSAVYVRAMGKAALISYNHSQDFDMSYQLYSKHEELTTDPDEKFEAQLGAMRSAYRIGNTKATASYASKVAANERATAEERSFARFFEGMLAYDQGQYGQARSAFEEVVKHIDDEQAAEARYLLADMDFREGHLDQAESRCRESFSANASYPTWVARGLILLSDILVEKKDLFNAKAALEAMVENFSEDPALVEQARGKIAAIEKLESESTRVIEEQSSTGNN